MTIDEALSGISRTGLHWFARRARGTVVPVVRTLISVPALPTALWTFVLAYAGRLPGSRFQQVEQ